MPDTSFTVYNRYVLLAPPEACTEAFAALVARVRSEGHPGVLRYRFFLNPHNATALGLIDYASPAAWIGHHEIAMPWPEMKALHGLARLEEITFLGEAPDEVRAWLEGSTLAAHLNTGNAAIAGFHR
ncbi:MAG: hypothetical protein JXQ91_13770 [Vannielia sp.]|uniref:hypothetical protein n=1 Tax=Vannielia sp. TaxID=2813045 RepID=UPI003B8D972F